MTGNANGYLLLERGPRAVTVPLLDELQPSLLHFLLLGAGVSLSQLKPALASPSDAPPRPLVPSNPPGHTASGCGEQREAFHRAPIVAAFR
jgi:hypothetical protein